MVINKKAFLAGMLLQMLRKLLPGYFFFNFVHAYRTMAFVVNTFTIFDDKYLRAFVVHIKFRRDLVADVSVTNEVKKIEIGIIGGNASLEASLGHSANAAAGTMFKDYLRFKCRLFGDLFQLMLTVQFNPIHIAFFLELLTKLRPKIIRIV